nr:MAG TPA: hypothetical protein [Caudoviricetes sp.]
MIKNTINSMLDKNVHPCFTLIILYIWVKQLRYG